MAPCWIQEMHYKDTEWESESAGPETNITELVQLLKIVSSQCVAKAGWEDTLRREFKALIGSGDGGTFHSYWSHQEVRE